MSENEKNLDLNAEVKADATAAPAEAETDATAAPAEAETDATAAPAETETDATAASAAADVEGDKSEADASAKEKVEYDESLFEGSTVFSAPKEDEKKAKHRTAKPRVKGLIISAVAVVVAAAVALTVWLVPYSKDPDKKINSEAKTYTVIKTNEAEVVSVDLHNKNGDIHIYVPEDRKSSKATSSGSASSGSTSSGTKVESYDWCVQGYEQYNMTGAMYILQSAINVSASKKLSAESGQKLAGDLKDYTDFAFEGSGKKVSDDEKNAYGFTEPYAVIDVNCLEEEDSYTMIIGSYTPDKSGRYVSVSGDDSVYVVPDGNFTLGKYSFGTTVPDLINSSMVDAVTETDSTSKYFVDGTLTYIDSLTMTGSCRENKLVVESAPEELSAMAFVVTSPSFRAGNEENISKVLGICNSGMSASGAYKLGYTDADLKQYGLDKPYSKIDIKIGSYEVTLTFGAPIDDTYYPCVVGGRDIIYKVAVADYEWVAYASKDIYFDSLFLEFIANIDKIVVETDEKTVTFDLVRENKSDGTDFDVKVEGYDDLKIDTQELCYYYGRILALSVEEYAPAGTKPSGTPYITFKISYTTKDNVDVISLYRYSTRRYFYTLNGQGDALVSAAIVQDLHKCLDTLLAGEKIGRNQY